MFSKSMSVPIADGRKLDEAEQGAGELVVASGNAAVCFDAAEEVFDLMAMPGVPRVSRPAALRQVAPRRINLVHRARRDTGTQQRAAQNLPPLGFACGWLGSPI